jgi:hypothetical protein
MGEGGIRPHLWHEMQPSVCEKAAAGRREQRTHEGGMQMLWDARKKSYRQEADHADQS